MRRNKSMAETVKVDGGEWDKRQSHGYCLLTAENVSGSAASIDVGVDAKQEVLQRRDSREKEEAALFAKGDRFDNILFLLEDRCFICVDIREYGHDSTLITTPTPGLFIAGLCSRLMHSFQMGQVLGFGGVEIIHETDLGERRRSKK
ncbi:hypothetical protein HGM15179_006443 [Zosterops borbonicus]|uniref:Uncharacterized protein n=1 Tax=Zosterops borbonicus TaxID=364589 RepID=A0A8K1GNI3_9PASS|nr:hypothetical protein HGM15179_006443 [Zosterops borbonicus]